MLNTLLVPGIDEAMPVPVAIHCQHDDRIVFRRRASPVLVYKNNALPPEFKESVLSRVRWYKMMVSTYPTVCFGAKSISCSSPSPSTTPDQEPPSKRTSSIYKRTSMIRMSTIGFRSWNKTSRRIGSSEQV
jgi:hypothetical protein